MYIYTTEPVPVMWDARIYSSAAVGLLHYFDEGGSFGHPERLPTETDSTASEHLFLADMEHYIKGERIEWLYYDIPTIEETQDYLFISGPVYPAFLAAVFLTDFAVDFMVVRTFNAVIDGFCVVLVMLIAAMLFDRRTAILAGILYIIYLPFILLTGLVSPDQLTILFILLTLYLLLRWYENKNDRYLYLSGALLGVLVLTRPTATLLFAPFLLGFLHDHKSDITGVLRHIAKAAVPFIIIVIPWVILASIYFGELAIRDPEYSAANFRSSSSIENEGYDLDYVDKDFWNRSVFKEISSDPLGYAGLLVTKFDRLWSIPFNDLNRSFVITPTVGKIIHRLIVLFGVFGVFSFALNRRRGLIYLFHIPFYYTLIHIVLHSLARYNLNPMPLIIIASAGAMMAVYEFSRRNILKADSFHVKLPLAICLAGIAFIMFFPESAGAAHLGGMLGAILTITVKILIMISIFGFIAVLVSKTGITARSIKVLGIPTVILLIVTIAVCGARDRWAEWECRLDSPQQVAGVRIFIPDDFRLDEGELARVDIDMVTNKAPVNHFHVMINGRRFSPHVLKPPVTEFYVRKMTYPVFEELLDIGKEEMRLWRKIPLSPQFFNQMADQYGVLDIAIMISDSLPEEDNFIRLFGGYDILSDNHLSAPGLIKTSIERFIDKGDPRIRKNYHLSSDSALSYYIKDLREREFREDDLSDASGRQKGRYRILLEVKRFGGKRFYF